VDPVQLAQKFKVAYDLDKEAEELRKNFKMADSLAKFEESLQIK